LQKKFLPGSPTDDKCRLREEKHPGKAMTIYSYLAGFYAGTPGKTGTPGNKCNETPIMFV
jgi:hypothetical protein